MLITVLQQLDKKTIGQDKKSWLIFYSIIIDYDRLSQNQNQRKK